MLRIPFIVILVLLCPVTGIVITEFCPDPFLPEDRDEYLILEGIGTLDGFMVTDGEGAIRFPQGTSVSGKLVIAMDAEAYYRSHGEYPDFEWEDRMPEIPNVIQTGRFQLANDHDQIALYSKGVCLQEVDWPGMVTSRQGQVHFLVNGSWDSRVLMIGQSRYEPEVFYGASGIAFVSPDCSREVFHEVVAGARQEILISIYEITSPVLAGYLADAHRRGVDVEILVEGGPVGGIPSEEHWVIGYMQGEGIPVRTMSGTETVHTPYRYLHSKYMVIDSRKVLVTSENFKENGFPKMGMRGNRGWGVVVTHEGLADYFKSVYTHDADGSWSIPAKPREGDEEPPSWQEYHAESSPYIFSGATVVPVISPDTSNQLHDLITGARVTVDIEMAYITNETACSLNPSLADALNVSRRGIPVRILLDSYYYNVEGEADNDEMVGIINDIAASEGLPLEARLADLSPGLVEKIHNKGVIVDGQKVLVSSINWNMNSPTFNREVGLIIEHAGLGEYYTGVFEKDWRSAEKRSTPDGPDLQKIAAAGVVISTLSLYALVRKRKGP